MIYEITSSAFFFFKKETGKIFRDVYVILERAKKIWFLLSCSKRCRIAKLWGYFKKMQMQMQKKWTLLKVVSKS